MPAYIIGYDIHPTRGETYPELIDAIKALGHWWHHLDSTWVVVTTKSAAEIRDALKIHLQRDDQLLVVKSGGESAWRGFNERGAQWLKDNL